MYRCVLLALLAALPATPALLAQKHFGFDNRKPSGQPYLTPEESLKRLQVPPGWEVTVFAAEPDIINPVAFTIDERGRLWVVECFEYPKRTPRGKKPRDRIKILEDTKGTGRADKVTVWAEGKDLPIGWDLATGIEVGNGGVYLGAAPYLFFLQDTKGTGKCDKQEILVKGFGSEDTHETLNTFQWGPDSKLYGLHGIFTHSQVDGVKMNAAVWRYDPRTKNFDIFAEGTSNPWGMDFDARGQCYLACCVIPHLFHIVPGGTYKRQAGASFNPHAYGLLNEICDHTHHKESGWAHAGLLVMEGNHVPKEYQGSVLMGSIHGCSIKRDVLRRNGSTFLAGHAPDFLVSGDKNFRPINIRWGPDGAIYVIDWHDQNPCHQAPPDSWDMTHGRIYKIQRKGAKAPPPIDLAKKSSKELVDLLANDNPWWYRTALRLLHERRDNKVAPRLMNFMLKEAESEAHFLRGLWGLYAIGHFDEEQGVALLDADYTWGRSWVVRLLGESGKVSDKTLAQLTKLAATEKAPEVRSQLASTAQRLTSQDTLPLLHNLMKHKEDARDPHIPLLIWLAYEPRVTAQATPALDWLKQNAPGNALVTNEIVPRTIRRLAAAGKAEDLAACVAFLGEVTDSAVRRQALEGLTIALKDRQVAAPAEWKRVFPLLLNDGDGKVHSLARRLAINFQDREAVRRALAIAADASKAVSDRLDAVHDLALAHPPEARLVLQRLLASDKDTSVRRAACRALASYDTPEVSRAVLAGYASYPAELRAEAVNLLAVRKAWARDLLEAVGGKRVERKDVGDNTILRIRAFGDKQLNGLIEKVWGRFRDTPAELNALIDKMRGQLHAGRASFERGRTIFVNQCAKCHKFDGKGHEVGPVLDGAARDIEYLLVNVLDPNRVVGQPYYVRVVELKDGRLETGLLHAEDETSITLKVENDQLKVIQKKDIEGKVRVLEKSVMPEGLANAMTVQDFRDLIRYTMAHPFLTEVAVAGQASVKAEGVSPPNLKGVDWTRPLVGAPGRIPLPASKEDGVALVATEVTAPEALKTRLQLGATQPVRVWLNGALVYKGIPGSGRAEPDQDGATVTLRPGVNRLLFEVRYRGDIEALYARLLDPER
ncbi:MAG TPA: PVC-type heme-binding CxxCH protein, partial [Gemmataceae bacterium]|nr:PVC-type heme-binding CxxCH protein [Gemmataceae bacterium]